MIGLIVKNGRMMFKFFDGGWLYDVGLFFVLKLFINGFEELCIGRKIFIFEVVVSIEFVSFEFE